MTFEKLDFWTKLTKDQKNLLENSNTDVFYKSGEIIHINDHDCIGVILVKTGELRAYISSEEGREITLFRLLPESVCVLSASCIISRKSFNINIDCIKDSNAILINKDAINRLSKENIYVENFINKETVNKFSKVTAVMEELLFMKLDKRIARFLLEESKKNDSLIIKLTHDKIAKYIGSAREVVSKQLNIFVKDNIISLNRGKVTIIDKKQLEKISGI